MAPESKSQSKMDFTQLFEAKSKEFLEHKVLEEVVVVKEKDLLETAPRTPEIYGFENEISLLENFLLDQKVYDELKSLVIVGEYGVGKTTLCKKIFNDEKVKSVYAPRIWISMHSKDSEERGDTKVTVVKRILMSLGVEDEMLKFIHDEAKNEYNIKKETERSDGETAEENLLPALLYALHLNLRWKKYLIVFDDVRAEDCWNENLGIDEDKLEGMQWGKHLSDGFPKGSGGRVIYTTREATLAKKLVTEEHEIHRLWPLSDTETIQKIYEEAITKNEKKSWKIEHPEKAHPGNEKKFKEELMNKSRGLPLAAIMMGKSNPVFEDISDPKGPTDLANNPISEKDSNTQPLQD